MSKKRINSRQKGKRIEREAAEYLRSLGFENARRTAQVRGNNDGAADLECAALSGWHIEVKGDESIQVGSAGWRAAIRQAQRDLVGAEPPQAIALDGTPLTTTINVFNGRRWAVLWRRKALPWCLTFCASDYGVVTQTGDMEIAEALKMTAAT